MGTGRLLAGLVAATLSGCSGEGALAGTPPWLAGLALVLVAGLAYALGLARAQVKRQRLSANTAGTAEAMTTTTTATAVVATSGASAAASARPPLDDRGAHADFGAQPASSPGAARGASVMSAPVISALLGAQTGAAVLAVADADGSWHVPLANAAARSLWSRLQWPASLDEVTAQLPPPAAVAAQAAIAGGQGASAAGWRVDPIRAADGSAFDALLVVQHTAAGDGGRASEGDSFSFTASHDLRAPIRVVEGFTRIVKEDYGHLLDRVGNDHLDRVLGAAARMNLMIDALLTLARLSQQPLARQPVNLSQLASYIVDDLRRAEPGREADVEIEPNLSAMGDPTLLRLVLENLIGNAWKYSARAARSQISLHTMPHAGSVAYVVRDNGAGFDMRSADRLFGLFQRLHSASEFPGHGVGLASVRRIVNRHGGEIWAEAEPGRGAAFFFTLAA